jgi:hypothetical protein
MEAHYQMPETPENKTLYSVSYGGGVQSTALLVMAARGMIDYRLFIFANTGDDSEHPDSVAYVRDIAIPYGKEHGIEVLEVAREGPTLLQVAMGEGEHASNKFPLPFYGENGAPMGRSCTADWKVRAVAKELRRRGASAKNPAHVALGISMDEMQRAKAEGYRDPNFKMQILHYPLLQAGMNRHDCIKMIVDEGLPEPGKSSCYFCPFHSRDAWQHLRESRPDLFAQSVQLEKRYKERLAEKGVRTQWLTTAGARSGMTLDVAINDQPSLFGGDECGGYCHT